MKKLFGIFTIAAMTFAVVGINGAGATSSCLISQNQGDDSVASCTANNVSTFALAINSFLSLDMTTNNDVNSGFNTLAASCSEI